MPTNQNLNTPSSSSSSNVPTISIAPTVSIAPTITPIVEISFQPILSELDIPTVEPSMIPTVNNGASSQHSSQSSGQQSMTLIFGIAISGVVLLCFIFFLAFYMRSRHQEKVVEKVAEEMLKWQDRHDDYMFLQVNLDSVNGINPMKEDQTTY
jgi:hypothetical protein